MRKYLQSILCISVILVLSPVVCIAKTDAVSHTSAMLEKTSFNGDFTVYVQKDGRWEKVGKLSYDKYLTEKSLSLGKHISASGKVNIRIEQHGGGAAHIDSVFLNGRPPVEVKSVEDGLKKLSRKDSDVIDAFGKTIEIVFGHGAGNNSLSLAARVESTVISKVPFQFPIANAYKKMDNRSSFYSYRLNSETGGMELDGTLKDLTRKRPFFKEFSKTGSGHPSGYTYGWVWNDDQNLYVAMDFTPDNTMDGDKDYAKVYTNVDGKIREFKVSVPEQKWGVPWFTYTNNVGYQHKTYKFKLPFKEISPGDMKQKEDIQLAFAAYGTASSECIPGYDDGDGVSAAIEDGAPNNGDGNGDDILDRCQSYVTSLPSATGAGYLTLVTESVGGTTVSSLRSTRIFAPILVGACQNSNVQASTEASQPERDRLFNFPYGLISFQVSRCVGGVEVLSQNVRKSQVLDGDGSVNVTVYYHGATSIDGFTYRKYGPYPNPSGSTQWYTMPGVTLGTADVGGVTVPTATFTIINNGIGDDDPGIFIVDQGGVGDPAVGIPTMTEWGMIIFMALAGLGALHHLRRQRRDQR